MTAASRNASLDGDLQQLRNRVVALSAQHHVGIPEIVSRRIVFTDHELRHGIVYAEHQEMTHSHVTLLVTGDPDGGGGGVVDASMHSTASMRARRVPRATAALNSSGIDDDFADQLDDDMRRLSVAEDVQRDFNRVVVASSVRGASQEATTSKQEDNSLSVSAWGPVEGRSFGVELETLLYKKSDEFLQDNAVKAQRDVAPTLKARLGAGYDFRFFDYQAAKDDREYKAWKITTDLSIRSEDGRSIFGLEFVTPKMVGGHGLLQVETVADELQRLGFATNNTTALHVHVSVEDLTNEEILRLCEYQAVFESVIDQFMTVPRRGDYSRYCRSNLRSMSLTRNVEEVLDGLRRLDVSKSINPLIRFFCPRLSAVRNSHRNHKVNLLLLARTKRFTPGRRIEFRQHQGSCDRQEIGAWVTLLLKWVTVASKLPRPGPRDGTVENFWKIIDEPKLKTYYTVKTQTMPNAVDFTYDSRELYSFQNEEIEPSDLDEPEEAKPAAAPRVNPPSSPLVGTAASAAPVLASPHFLGHQSPAVANAPPTVSFVQAVAATSPPVVTSPVTPPQPTPATSAMVTAVTGVGAQNTPVPPPRRDGPNFVRETQVPPTVHVHNARGNLDVQDRADSLSSDSLSSGNAPAFGSMSGHPPAFSASVAEHDDKDDSIMMRDMLQRRHEATRRNTNNNFSMGNHMFTCAIRVEAHYYGEGCVPYDQIVVADPSITVAREANSKDPRNWYITSPTEPSRSGRRDIGVRWISPWLTEARGLETAGRVVDLLQDSCQIDEEMFFFIHVAVNHKSNSEVGLICAAVVAFEDALCRALNLSISPNADAQKAADAVAQIISATSAASGEAFPNLTDILRRYDGPSGKKLLHLRAVTGTTYKAPKRELLFEVGKVTAEQLAQRAAFLSFFCAHCTKKLTPGVIQAAAKQQNSVQQLLALIDTLPASVARSLS